MFGAFRKSKAVQASVSAIKQSLNPYIFLRGQPPRFWLDPFVMGYVAGTSLCCTRIAYNSKTMPDNATQAEIFVRVHADVSSLNPVAAATFLSENRYKSPDFSRGFDAALKIFCFANERLDDELKDEDVKQAFLMAKATGQPVDRGSVCGMLHVLLVTTDLDKRFSDNL